MDPAPACPGSRTARARTVSLLAVLAVLTALGVGACSSDDPGNAAATSTGAARYQQSCASCHGTTLRGTGRGPSLLSEVYVASHHPDASFQAAITRGATAHHWNFGDMAPVAGLNNDEIDQIIAYVREQQAAHGLEPYPPR